MCQYDDGQGQRLEWEHGQGEDVGQERVECRVGD